MAYVANGRRGLSILDLSPLSDGDPDTQPQRTGSYYTGGTAHRTTVRGGLLFVADGPEGLKILDHTRCPTFIGVDQALQTASLPG